MAQQHTRIMVVDGSTVSRAILSRILRQEIEGAEVVECKTGAEALDRLESEPFDLVTTALLLPDMDGLDLSRKLRKSRRHHYTPVVVVSGDADARLLREGFKAGVTDYFDKSQGYKAFGGFIKSFITRHSGLVGRILFVEDSRTAAAVTCDILENHGLQVDHYTSAEAALEALENLDSQLRDSSDRGGYDLVITDFYLKGSMTGGDLLHAVRAKMHYSQQELPLLVITGTDDYQTQVEVFHAGANDFVAKPIVEEILIARVRALLLIKHQYDALKQQAETMRWLAATDSLTGVRSKRYLLDHGEDFIRDPANQPVCAMVIDIDHFKQINDSLGHITGDHVLADLGELLDTEFRDAMVVRFGGEEFCLLVPATPAEEMLERAEALRRRVAGLRPAGVDITVSIGLASSADAGGGLTQLISRADEALYAAKDAGRNRIHVHLGDEILPSPLGDAPALAPTGN